MGWEFQVGFWRRGGKEGDNKKGWEERGYENDEKGEGIEGMEEEEMVVVVVERKWMKKPIWLKRFSVGGEREGRERRERKNRQEKK